MTEHWQDELAEEARRILPAAVYRYVAAGAREELTVGEAHDAWRRVRLLPRVLRAVGEADLATTFLGTPCASPVAIAPTSLQRLAHPEGEVEMARGARDAGSLLVVSSNAGTPFEEISGTGVRWWLQAYLTADRELIAPTIRRAVDAGAAAVVLTVDTPHPGTKYDLEDGALGDLAGVYGVNHPEVVRGRTAGAEHARDLGPRDIAWLREASRVPVVVKGVLRADDARSALDAGASGVWVSNHGGRQLDRSVPTAQALPDVVDAVDARAEVYVDGGVRSGLDTLAALSVGARGVFLGRPPVFALATGGSTGVSGLLRRLGVELAEALVLAGCPCPGDAPDLRPPHQTAGF